MNNANSIKLNDSEIIQTIHGYQKKKKVINVVMFILYLGILGGFFAAVFFMAWSNGILAIVSTVVAIICASVIGASLGFLKYNKPKAQVFMGDTGSLALGGLLGTLAILGRCELLLAIFAGVIVAETLSVILQVTSYKLTGKRIFS